MSLQTFSRIFFLCLFFSSALGQDPSENAIPDLGGENGGGNEKMNDLPSSTSDDPCTGIPAALRSEKGSFHSPGFIAGGYPNNANCQWLIVVPSGQAQLYFRELFLEAGAGCLFDHVRVHDGPSISDRQIGRFCGTSLPGPIVGSTNTLSVVFSTDFIVSNRGFNASYASSDLVGPPVDACAGPRAIMRGSRGAFISPGYLDGSYPNNAACVWTLTVQQGRIRLKFTDFDVEGVGANGGCVDTVIVRDGSTLTSIRLGTACGTGMPNEVISSSNSLTVTFSTNTAVALRGFRAEYQQVSQTEVGSGFLGCNGQIFSLSRVSGLFTSPGYFFGSYPNSATCRYQITLPQGRVGVQFLTFNMEESEGCTNDWMTVFDGPNPIPATQLGRFCGTNIPAQGIMASSGTLFIQFSSNAATSATGFAAIYLTLAGSATGIPPGPVPTLPSVGTPGTTVSEQSTTTPVPTDGTQPPPVVEMINRGVKETCLLAHNRVRALHQDTGPLMYDDTLAEGAAQWAQHLAENELFEHSNTGLGENLFFGSISFRDFTFSPGQAVFQWYSEFKDYNFDTASSNTGEFMDVGHFTQVVWRNTLRLGCGVATVFRNGQQNTYIVARYSPPGNFLGLFAINILPFRDAAQPPTSFLELTA